MYIINSVECFAYRRNVLDNGAMRRCPVRASRPRFRCRLLRHCKCFQLVQVKKVPHRSTTRIASDKKPRNYLDETTQQRLRAYYKRNRAATERVTAELSRRAYAVTQMLDGSTFSSDSVASDNEKAEEEADENADERDAIQDVTGESVSEASRSPAAAAASDADRVSFDDLTYEHYWRKQTSVGSNVSESNSEIDTDTLFLGPEQRGGVSHQPAPRVAKSHAAVTLRRRKTERPCRPCSLLNDDQSWRSGAEALTGFVTKRGSRVGDLDSLVHSYDVFEPDMRSIRWNEFCFLMQQHRSAATHKATGKLS